MAAVEYVNSPRGAVQALTYVWDVGLLAWVEGTQSGGGGGGGGTSSNFSAVFPSVGTAAGAKSDSDGSMSPFFVDGGGNLRVAPPINSTIGSTFTNQVFPVGVKDNSGNIGPLTLDASGNLLVAVTGAGSGGTSSADRAAYTAGTTAGTPMMVAHDDTAPGTLAEDKVGIARGSSLREVYTQIRDAAGNDRGVNISAANALKVDGSAVTQPISGTLTSSIHTLAKGATPAGDPTSLNVSPTIQALDINLANQSVGNVQIKIQDADSTIRVSTRLYDDAYNGATIKPASTASVAADTALVVALSPNSSIPTGSNAIGKLAANDGVDVGDVTINNAAGAAAVNVQDGGNSLTVDGSVTVSGLPSSVDNSAFTFNTTIGVPFQAVVDDSATNSVSENRSGTPRMSPSRVLYSNIRDNLGHEVGVESSDPGLLSDYGLVVRPIPSQLLPTPASQANVTNSVTNTNAWVFKITDTINGPVAVKAASTAAVVADVSLVVALSPNSPLPAGSAVIGHIITDSGSITDISDRSARLLGHVTVDSVPSTSIPADVFERNYDPGYAPRATAKNLTQTVDGHLRTEESGWQVDYLRRRQEEIDLAPMNTASLFDSRLGTLVRSDITRPTSRIGVGY